MTSVEILREQSATRGRYLIRLNGELTEAELTWAQLGDHIVAADHTDVPDIFRGRGFGMLLVEHLVIDARDRGLRVVPLCPFVRAQYQRHPEWSDVFGGPAATP
ncbi:GNAT family N-acetyltransferase [Phaeovulum sp.]|uniref:GNAT family N-acetyltransferase n=1 Tax=Phaeovulum sp. TaxID=2934796 RepID=UPI002730116A|nr:GNAT family N-acetyltransferase [Phaeovulum sp.]MDP1668989.1 GNAT family N-acetyltransferase [Phaeovulum sp.]MDZ4117903.1 GNAT family N-acetyltransferase [Phaeovulum sp.]